MGDFVTAVKHKLPIKVIIIKNNMLGQIKWEQMVFLGNPEYGVELQPIDFVKFAEACGGVGFRCEKPDEVRPALEAAFASTEAGDRRGGRRPVRAADAGQSHAQAGAAPRRVARARRAGRRQDRGHDLPRQGQGTGLSTSARQPTRRHDVEGSRR